LHLKRIEIVNRHEIDSFQQATKEDWKKVAQKELDGQDPDQALTREVEKLIIKPFYDQSDLDNGNHNILLPSENAFRGPRAWVNAPLVDVVDEKTANEHALNHLNHGAEGVVFRVGTDIDLDLLLKEVELPHCSVSFILENGQTGLSSAFERYVRKNQYDLSQVSGAMLSGSLPVNLDFMESYQPLKNYFPIGTIIKESPPIEQLANTFIKLIRWLDDFNEVREVKSILSAMAFSFEIGPDFFIEIARLKSFRELWRRITFAYGIPEMSFPFIHAHAQAWQNKDFKPNENMLKGTTAALSAILGGADKITVDPDTDQPFKNRIARNVSSILKEESHLSAVSDATAGSYYLESLIDQITVAVWKDLVNHVDR
jgi:methylmalonyl-CoA mutase